LEKRSYKWFEKRRRTKALDLAQEQIVKALDTVTMLSQAVQSLAEGKKEEATRYIQYLFKTEEEVDRLRKEVFKELSKGAALFADYREDILHLVKRLDTLADHVKDAARCMEVEEIEHGIDEGYLNTKKLFVKYGGKMNPGTIVIFDDLIEFIEQAADMCADTADYIVILSSREQSESTGS
jgi:uncharacterized protein Yka (UPF0111/DUF47 family)